MLSNHLSTYFTILRILFVLENIFIRNILVFYIYNDSVAIDANQLDSFSVSILILNNNELER